MCLQARCEHTDRTSLHNARARRILRRHSDSNVQLSQISTVSPSLAAPFLLLEGPVPWTGVLGYGTVGQGSYPTTLTPRTM